MDIYDYLKRKLEKYDQKKFLVSGIIIAIILIVVIILFIIYVHKMANKGVHAFDPSGVLTEKRLEDEEERRQKYLDNPEYRKVYEKLIVNKDISF